MTDAVAASPAPAATPTLPYLAFRRINVVGTTGSGKTTLARELARRRGLMHIELDALFWEPRWTEAEPNVFRARTVAALDAADQTHDGWAVDGNYSRVQPVVWGRADTVVWLDYPLPVILRQLFARTLRRTIRQEELWSGNRERFFNAFFSRDSILLWALKTYRAKRRDYPRRLAAPENAHLSIVRLRSPREMRRWLETLLR
jgi:adenylate kinase family enzyme